MQVHHLEAPALSQMYNSGADFDNYERITSPSSKQMAYGGSRLQDCDLVEVQNFDVPVSFPKWESVDSGPIVTSAGSKVIIDETSSMGSSAVEVPTSTIDSERVDANLLGDNEGRKCQICNDVASGFHYGVWSCEGCKAFFKRSLQGPVDYVCPATNTCTIDKQRRKACQACRLRKCIEMGMTRGNCRPEKHHGDDATVEAPLKKKRAPSQQKAKKESDSQAAALAAAGTPLIMDSPKSSVLHPLVERLLAIDSPNVLMSDHDTSQPDSQASLMNSILREGGKELLDAIQWAKSVPGYLDLPLHDRVHLLESCWIEINVCGLCWRSMPYAAQQVLVFAPDLIMDRARCVTANMLPECSRLLAVTQTFAELQLTREEFVLLKATVLMNAEVVNSGCETILRRNRDNIMQAWYAQCDPRRVCLILLMLPHIRQVSLHGLAKMFELKAEQVVSFSDLMGELLEARFTSGRVSSYISHCAYPNSQMASPVNSPTAEGAPVDFGAIINCVKEEECSRGYRGNGKFT